MHPLFFVIFFWLGLAASSMSGAEFRFGAAQVDITPDYPIRLSGYVARKTESEGVHQQIFTKALAIAQNDAPPALILTIDNVAISREFRDQVVQRIGQKHQVPAERIVIFSSHTHSAPCLQNAIANIFATNLPPAQEATIERYTRETLDHMVAAGSEALARLEPAKLYFSQGEVGFARNRRTPGGPVDHALPVLVVRRADGTVGAILAGYACHCTTLQANFIHGDWAGVAQREIQNRNPGATALIAIGCGADANPSPRGDLEHAEAHGKALADAVQRLLAAPSTQLTSALECRAREFALPFSPLPSLEEWKTRAEKPGIVGYHARKNLARLDRGETLPKTLPYMAQTWTFGHQLAMVFLPGEVVVDYALALKQKFDPGRLWVAGYANWVPCYIPSKRILQEGGYEAEESLWYYDRPARLAPEIEDLILENAGDLLPADFRMGPR